MSQVTLKKIKSLFCLSPIDTGVKKYIVFICLEEEENAHVFFNFSFKQENNHGYGMFI